MATKKPARDLTKFSSLISSLTLPAMLEKALEPKLGALTGELKKISEFAQSSLRRAAETAGKSSKATLSFPLWDSWSVEPIETAMGLSEEAAQEAVLALRAAQAALGSLDPARKEKAAQALSLHLCASYERQGSPGLGFPLLGEGLRRSKTIEDGVTVKGVSGWRGSLSMALNVENHGVGDDNLAEKEIAEELAGDIKAIETLNSAQQHLRAAQAGSNKEPSTISDLRWVGQELQSGDNLGYGKFGVDLAGKQRALAKPEAPLACVERIERSASLKSAARLNGLDKAAAAQTAAMWRVFTLHSAGAALARALGDVVNLDDSRAAQALRPGYALRSSCSALTEREKNTNYYNNARVNQTRLSAKEWGALEALYAQAPLTYCAQLAQEIAVREVSSHRSVKAPYEALSAAALSYLKELSDQSASLASRALEIAKNRQMEWLKKEGLEAAWSSMLASEKDRLPNAKALSWALAHPETAAMAGDNTPKGALSAGMARALGIVGASSEALFSAVAERLEREGLSAAALEWSVGNSLGARLTLECQKTLQLAGREKELQQDRFALAARVTQAAFERSVAPKIALEAFDVFSSDQNQNVFRSGHASNLPAIGDNLSASLPYRDLEDARGAEELRTQAEAKKQKLSWLIGEAIERFAELRQSGKKNAPESTELSVDSGGASMGKTYGVPVAISRELALLAQQPAIDWVELDPLIMKWDDALMRRSPQMARARREALADGGVAGRIAVVCAAGLGIENPQGGNDLIAKTREALKESWGLSQGGWKALLKSPTAVIEGAVSSLRDTERLSLDFRAQQSHHRAKSREISKPGAMRGAWLSAMAQYNLPAEPINQLLSIVSSGRQGFDAVNDWGPYIGAQTRGTEQGAIFFIAEAKAKEERLPHVVKALCDRYAARLKESQADPAWREERLWKGSALSSDELVKHRAASLVCQDWSLVSDWINKSEDGVWQTLPEKPTWNQLWRLQKEWHDEVAAVGATTLGAKSKANPGAIAWPSPLGRHTQGDWMAVELTNGRALAEEGREMGHCVSSYSSNCRSGELRLFSIRFGGQRVCTMELQAARGKQRVSFNDAQPGDAWEITQNKGKHNASVKDKGALEFCAQTALAYKEAFDKKIVAERARAAGKAKERRDALKLVVNVEEGPEDQPAPEEAAPKVKKAKKAPPKA